MYKLLVVAACSALFAIVLAFPAQEQTQAISTSSSSSSQSSMSSSDQSSMSSSSHSSSSSSGSSSSSSSSSTTTPATIIKQIDVNNPDGSYNSSYETSNGIKVENAGFMKKIMVPKGETADGQTIEEHEELVLVQMGSYSYIDPEGNTIMLRYIADENGFQPQGEHLPVSSVPSQSAIST